MEHCGQRVGKGMRNAHRRDDKVMNSSANRRGSGEAWAEQYAEQISTIFTHTQNGKVKEEEKKV